MLGNVFLQQNAPALLPCEGTGVRGPLSLPMHKLLRPPLGAHVMCGWVGRLRPYRSHLM